MLPLGIILSCYEYFCESVTLEFVRQTALLLAGFIIISFSKARSHSLFRSICKFSTSLLFKMFLYIIQSSAKSVIVGSLFFQISFTYARNNSGQRILPCDKHDVTLISFDNCTPSLTLCVRSNRNSLIHTTSSHSIARL
jgi:hypothetical protein